MPTQKIWKYGNFYAKEKNFLKKPKYVWLVLKKLINNKKSKKILFWDIGCGEGSLIKYFEKIFPKWSFMGSENNPVLVKAAKKNTENSNIFSEDLFNSSKHRANIIFCGAVLPIYDDIEMFINQLIKRSSKSGEIIFHCFINHYPIDMLIRLRNCNEKNFLKKKIDLPGWNFFSKKTIHHILKKNKKVKSHKFITINFPKNLVVKKGKFMRSWTETIRNKVYFISETQMLQDSILVHIKIR